jgi:hypothetical protein
MGESGVPSPKQPPNRGLSKPSLSLQRQFTLPWIAQSIRNSRPGINDLCKMHVNAPAGFPGCFPKASQGNTAARYSHHKPITCTLGAASTAWARRTSPIRRTCTNDEALARPSEGQGAEGLHRSRRPGRVHGRAGAADLAEAPAVRTVTGFFSRHSHGRPERGLPGGALRGERHAVVALAASGHVSLARPTAGINLHNISGLSQDRHPPSEVRSAAGQRWPAAASRSKLPMHLTPWNHALTAASTGPSWHGSGRRFVGLRRHSGRCSVARGRSRECRRDIPQRSRAPLGLHLAEPKAAMRTLG